MLERGFLGPQMDDETAATLAERARTLRAAVLTMTTLAASGHPGGSMSSLEMYQLLYGFARIDPADPLDPDRDRIVVSHGHTSPGVYVALADAGFFELDDAVAHFRQAGSPFEGHVERTVPGIEWNTGNLGQGLSAGLGFLAAAMGLFAQHCEGKADHARALWTLLVLDEWLDWAAANTDLRAGTPAADEHDRHLSN